MNINPNYDPDSLSFGRGPIADHRPSRPLAWDHKTGKLISEPALADIAVLAEKQIEDIVIPWKDWEMPECP